MVYSDALSIHIYRHGTPAYTNPAYAITYGDDLNTIDLPDKDWNWESTMNGILPVGNYTRYASYSPVYFDPVSNIPITITVVPYSVRFKVEVS